MTTDEPLTPGLTELERRVLGACDRLQRRGEYPSQPRLAREMHVDNATVLPVRDDLIARGLLVLTTRPRDGAGYCRERLERARRGDLDDLDARVLEACLAIRAEGGRATLGRLAALLPGERRGDVATARARLERARRLVPEAGMPGRKARPSTAGAAEARRLGAHQSTGEPFEAEARAIRRVMRWARRTAAKGGG
jgi:DNA-binding transcriptional MocR family regulator